MGRCWASCSKLVYGKCLYCCWSAVDGVQCKKLCFSCQQEKVKWIWQFCVEKAGIQWAPYLLCQSTALLWEERGRKGQCRASLQQLEFFTTARWGQWLCSLNNCSVCWWEEPGLCCLYKKEIWWVQGASPGLKLSQGDTKATVSTGKV